MNTKKVNKEDKEFEAWAQKWKLDDEEREILASVERGEWKPVRNWRALVKRHAEYARYTIAKNRSVTFRVNAWDIEKLKARAIQEGIPYQTLLSSVVHKYVSGRLKDSD